MLVAAADAASTSGTAFSIRIEGFVNCLVPEKISLRFLEKMKEKKKNEENERVTREAAVYRDGNCTRKPTQTHPPKPARCG